MKGVSVLLFFVASAVFSEERTVAFDSEADWRLKESLPDLWEKTDVEEFWFVRPADLQSLPIHPIDSHVGRYKSEKIELTFDYGWYSDSLNYKGMPGYKEHREKIDGKPSKIVSFKKNDSAFVIAVHVPKVKASEKNLPPIALTMMAQTRSETDFETALKIFRSLRFK